VFAEISRCFGGDCTASALENRLRRVKADAKAIKIALQDGIDPINLDIGPNGVKGTGKTGLWSAVSLSFAGHYDNSSFV
jgi:hypothetical protein